MRFTLLGRSGLRVSELALGTMTFGETGWGVDATTSARLLDLYTEAGGNFLDTANIYADGRSEQILGDLLKGRRERFVLATKYTLQTRPGDLNSAGNHRKNLEQSLEASLRRLQTDYLDVFWVHTRESWTPVPEIMRALDDQVRKGKVLHVGVSDWPAWEVAQANTLADLRGWSPFIGLQLRYNLLERTPERELLPMARTFELGVTAWGPLAEGRLTGRYLRSTTGRLDVAPETFQHSKDNAEVIRLVVEIAEQLGRTPAQVAIAWLRSRPGTVVPIVGATREEQLRDNLAASDVTIPQDQLDRLDAASAVSMGFPHELLEQGNVKAGTYGDQWALVMNSA